MSKILNDHYHEKNYVIAGIHLFSLIIIVWLCVFSSASHADDSVSPPNIVLIVSDYMGYADIEPFGATDIKTPALSMLAAQGVKFSSHYSAAPMCIPARAALMSGLYPSKVLQRQGDAKGLGLSADNNNLMKHLKSNGYATALIGKWHLGDTPNFKPRDHGFDYFFGFNDWTLGYHDHLTSDGLPGLYRNETLLTEEGYLTELFSDEAATFVENNAENPFFLYLSYNTGLPPYQGPNLHRSKWASGWDPNKATRADYVAMVEAMDQGIDKLIKKLNELELNDNTIVIFTYDHGGRHLVDSGPLFHGFSSLWEGGIRVPLIIRWPNRVASGQTISSPTIAMDLTATMVDMARVNRKPISLDGLSLRDIKDKLKVHRERPLFWKHGRMKAVRQGDWKYIVDGHTQLLFNLDTDIGERKNLFSRHPKKVTALKALLSNWQASQSSK